MSSYYVDRILEEKKITDFLEENGIYPLKKSGEKYVYRCPIHSGDNDPSFLVYPVGTKGRNYQTYHCFGCHSGINIINLKSDLDNVSIKDAIKFFLKGMNIEAVDVIDSTISSIVNGIRGTEKEENESDTRIELKMMMLNTLCRKYLLECDDEEETDFFEDIFFKKVDELAMARDIDTLDEYFEMLVIKNVLLNRKDAIRKRREDAEASAKRWIV